MARQRSDSDTRPQISPSGRLDKMMGAVPAGRSRPVNWVDLADALRFLHRLDIEVDDHGFLAAAHEDAFQWFGGPCVYFLVRNVGRNIDEVARAGFGDVLQPLPPPHAGA